MILEIQHEVKLVNKTKYRRWEINYEYMRHVKARTKQALHAQFPRGHKLPGKGPWWLMTLQLYSGRVPDVGSCSNSVKAILDALVQEKVIPDDNPEYIEGHVFLSPFKVKDGCEGAIVMLFDSIDDIGDEILKILSRLRNQRYI